MATDPQESPHGASPINQLTLKVNSMLKKPTLDTQLSEALDSFISEISQSEHYLSNGIVNIKFAEAGLFLESSASLYGKRVDLLCDNALEYQMQLCAYNKSRKENVEEAEKIAQRIRRNKRKKVIQNVVEKLPFLDDLMNDIQRSNKVLESCPSIMQSDALINKWKEINKNKTIHDHPNGEAPCNENHPAQPCSDFYCRLNQNVNLDSSEKLTPHSELIMNRLLPYVGSFDNIIEPERVIGGNNQDWILQKYLRHVGITCKKFWLERCGHDFKLFCQRIQQIDALLPSEANAVGLPNLSVVNVIRLPEELMAEYTKNNDVHVRVMIHDLLVKERQSSAARIKKNSERVSEADSAFHEMFHDTDSRSCSRPDTNLMSQHSFVDSGIFEDQPSVASCHVDELELDCEESGLPEEVPVGSEAAACSTAHPETTGLLGEEAPVCSEEVTCNISHPNDSLTGNSTQLSQGYDSGFVADTTINDNDSAQVNSAEIIIHSIITLDSSTLNPNIGESDSVQDNLVSVDVDLKKNVNDHSSTSYQATQENATFPSIVGLENNSSRQEEDIVKDNLNKFINTTVNYEENCKVGNGQNRISTPFCITVPSVIKPLREESSKTKKRLKLTDLNDGESVVTPKRPRLARTKWLQTVATTFWKFENFYLRHYCADDGEEEYAIEPTSVSHFDEILPSTVDAATLGLPKIDNLSFIPHNIDVIENETQNATDDETDSQCILSTTPCSPGSMNNDTRNITSVLNDTVHPSTSNYFSDAHSSNRTKAVTDWRNFIEPKLKELHETTDFDIHYYGGQIIGVIPEGEAFPFKDLVSNKKPSEVCRYFLASLQLANTYNIELSAPDGEMANDSFTVKLLTKERYHEHLEEYEAPSENTFREKLARAQAACPSKRLHSTPTASIHKQSRKRMKL